MGQGVKRVQKEDVMTGIKVRVMELLVLKMEEGTMSQGMEEGSRSRKGMRMCSPLEPPEECSLTDASNLV